MAYFMGDITSPRLIECQRYALLSNAIDLNLVTTWVRYFSEPYTPTCCITCIIHGAKCQFDCDCRGCSAPPRPALTAFTATSNKLQQPSSLAPADPSCALCGCTEGAETMPICDGCDKGFHLRCLVPPTRSLPPSGIFLCPSCDPDFANKAKELYNPATPLAYRPQGPL